MPTGGCCAIGCSNRSGHLFPKDVYRRKQWEIAVRRENFRATDSSLLCKEHFLESDYHASEFGTDGFPRKRKYLKKTAVPSVFQWTKSKTQTQQSREERHAKRRKTETTKEATQWQRLQAEVEKKEEVSMLFSGDDIVVGAEEEIWSTDIEIVEDGSLVVESSDICQNVISADRGVESRRAPCSSSDSFFFAAVNRDEVNDRNDTVHSGQVDNTSSVKAQQPYLCVDAIKHSDKLVHHYTGLENYCVFQHAFWSLGNNVHCLTYAYSMSCECLSPENQFLLMLVKLRRHYPHLELARMFCVSEFTVQNVWMTWVNFCYYQWGEINWWPQRRLVTHYCPADFKLKFPSTRVIVDATEVRVKHPSNPRAQKASFSAYKHGNTVKALVGVTPGGLTSYVSSAYGGSTSDRQIVERSPLPLLCESGDSIMADKGFNVQDIFAPRNVQINIPAFFKKKNRLSAATLRKDRKIASKRVHVERIIGMAKVYTICQHKLNILETKLASRIITVCFYLCNFRMTVVSRFA